ncbi:MAG: DUF5597 domain-containing protein [Pirellulales bacterium]|nr:DUF5597 domain-containing protein [Pirellulales bacterium]
MARRLVATLAVALACRALHAEEVTERDRPLPHLAHSVHGAQLIVDSQPFLMLGGELGNSTASDLAVLAPALQKCRRMNLNVVLVPVSWDLVEPVEGEFDFSLVEGAIDIASDCDLRLLLLWFGTWKNSMSCYAPSWVKRDVVRFPRARRASGEPLEFVSPACTAACEADARAFAALMRRLREYDSREQTVLMVQVENEVGMIPEPRDRSAESEQAYRGAVPAALATLAVEEKLGPEVGALWEHVGRRSNGSWSEMFGSGPWGEEAFTAWQFATYVEQVAAAGKCEYPLPMFANAALIRPDYLPGKYPSAGPLPHLLEIWRAGAPSLDMICPDIYFPNFMEWCDKYVRNGNPLFIPEMAASRRVTGNIVYAAARFRAMGFGPFSIENVDAEKGRLIADCYETLGGMTSLILKSQREGTVLGLSPQVEFDWTVADEPQRGELAGVRFEAVFDRESTGNAATTTLPTLGAGRWDAPPGTPTGAAMILHVAEDEFAVVAMGATITAAPADGVGKVGLERVQEGRYDRSGKWIGGRWLNGDETHQGRHLRFYDGRWTVQRVKIYRY